MAEAYKFVGTEASTELAGTDELTDVQRTTFTAYPSGVTFAVSVAAGADLASRTAAEAAPVADAFNAAAATPGVAALSTSQEVNAAGQISDVANITVQSESGKGSTTVVVPMSTVQGGDVAGAIADALAQLQELENL